MKRDSIGISCDSCKGGALEELLNIRAVGLLLGKLGEGPEWPQ